MTRISSRYVFVYKTLFPILWFGVRGVEEDIPLSNVMNVRPERGAFRSKDGRASCCRLR